MWHCAALHCTHQAVLQAVQDVGVEGRLQVALVILNVVERKLRTRGQACEHHNRTTNCASAQEQSL